MPFGEWTKNLVLKEAGRLHKKPVLDGLEGYTLHVMTRYGEPEPWTLQEVKAFLAKGKRELEDPRLHIYGLKRRIWARKPAS